MFIQFTTKNDETVVIKLVSGEVDELLDALAFSEHTIDIQMAQPHGIIWETVTEQRCWTFTLSEDVLNGVEDILTSTVRFKIPAIKWVRNYVIEQTGMNSLGLLEAKCLVEHIADNDIQPDKPFYVYNKNKL